MATLSDELKNEIREYLIRKLREGFDDPRELPQYACEYTLDGEPNAEAEAFAKACLQDVLIDYRSEQRQWPAVTDCDRLDTAFADLADRRRREIVAIPPQVRCSFSTFICILVHCGWK